MFTEDQQAEVARYLKELDGVIERHIADIKTISDALNNEAEENGWCDRYDRFQDEINQIIAYPMELRRKEFTGWIELKVRMRRPGIIAKDAGEVTMTVLDDSKMSGFITTASNNYFIEQFEILEITCTE